MARFKKTPLDRYNPWRNQAIDPNKAEDLSKNLYIPSCLHDAVARAKTLVQSRDIKKIKILWKEAAKYSEASSLLVTDEGAFKYHGRDYCPANDSDNLVRYLRYANHDIPIKKWPSLFGALALGKAGEVYEILYPPKERYQKEFEKLPKCEQERIRIDKPCAEQFILQIASNTGLARLDIKEILLDLAIEAIRSVGVGEGLQAALPSELRKRKLQDNAAKPPHAKTELYKEFIHWALKPENQKYSSTQKASEAFHEALKQGSINTPKTERFLNTFGDSTHLRLKSQLEKHCKDNSINFPFPRKRSKTKN